MRKYLCKNMLWSIVTLVLVSSAICDCKLNGLLQDLVDIDFENLEINKACINDLMLIRRSLSDREIWAIKLLDASAHVSEDFIWGNNALIGSPASCGIASTPFTISYSADFERMGHVNLSLVIPPIPIQYKAVYARHKSKMQIDMNQYKKDILNMGFCLPSSCDDLDTQIAVDFLMHHKDFTDSNILGDSVEVFEAKDLDVKNDFWNNGFVHSFIYIFLIVLCLIILDGICRFFGVMKTSDFDSEMPLKTTHEKQHENSFILKFVSCFSIVENVKIIFSKNLGNDSLEVIHGIRAVGMMMFIIAHIFVFGISSTTNSQQTLILSERLMHQPLFTIHLTLDTFFVLSGTVLSYLFFQQIKTRPIKNDFVYFVKIVMNRYLRLTPAYVMTILLTVTLTRLVKNVSPYYLIDDDEEKCTESWFLNILYINNFFPLKGMCMIWSWFLGVDLQCFMITTILLLIVNKHRNIGLILFATIFGVTTIANGYMGYILKFEFTTRSLYSTADHLYTPFWTRICVYFVGAFTGWYLSSYNRIMNINKRWIVLGWIIGPFINTSLVFVHWFNHIPPVVAGLYLAFGRTAWAIGCAWLIIACSAGHGGFINAFFSSDTFLTYSRLTYGTYLVNPLVIMFTTMTNNVPYHIDYPMLLITSIGFIFTSFGFALVFVLFFETPFIRLIKLFS